jgi:hypothetical protein
MKDGFCHIVAYGSYVNLGFNRGALLPDPGKALHGTGKNDLAHNNPQPR